MANLEFHRSNEKNWRILSAVGRMDTQTSPLAETTALAELQQSSQLALDAAGLDYISSAGLRIILKLAKQAKQSHKAFCLIGATGLVHEVLEESGMDMLIQQYAAADDLP